MNGAKALQLHHSGETMLFSSLEFIFIFFPISLIIYSVVPSRARVSVLLAISLVFYAWSGIGELPIMIAVILLNYAGGVAIEKLLPRKRRAARWVAALTVVANVATLLFFKYSALGAELLRLVPVFSDLPQFNIPLPIGISFYTFQALSYVVDVYRRECEAEISPVRFATYISLYPQLIAGPIVRYTDVSRTLRGNLKVGDMADGIERFVFGLSKKMLIANPAGEIWSQISSTADPDRTALAAWLGIVCFSFQIYFDFSGYSDMAIGLGKIYGFDFPENFNYPYVCTSVSDFWRRWHITLSSFFKSYVYIPLGGNRRGYARTYLNLLAVWSLTGLWHGASINFLLWGIYYFVWLSFEKSKLGKLVMRRLPKLIYRILTLFAVLGGWLIFACDRPGQISGYLGSMLTNPASSAVASYDFLRLIPFLILAAITSTPLPMRLFEKLRRRLPCAAAVVTFSLFLLSVAYLVNSSYNPFLYFRF